jgi:hypothetical protein
MPMEPLVRGLLELRDQAGDAEYVFSDRKLLAQNCSKAINEGSQRM